MNAVRGVFLLFAAAVAVRAAAAARVADLSDAPYQARSPWPVMRHDRRNTGRSPIVAAYHGDRPWAFRTGKGIFSTPIIGADGTVYVGSADTYFYAIGPSGALRWRFRTGNVIDSAAVIGRSEPASRTSPITFGSGDEFLYHIRSDRRMSRNRRILWKLRATQPPGSGQLVDWWEGNAELGPDGTIYAGNTGDAAYAVNPDGTVKWVYRSSGSFWTAAAIAGDGTTYWGSLDFTVHAIDAAGDPSWRRGTFGFVVSSPALATDGTLYEGSFDGRLYALDAATGRPRWSFGTSDHVYSSPALDEDPDGHVTAIYFGSTDGSIYAVDPAGELLWRYETGNPVRSSPALAPAPRREQRKVLYVGSANGVLYAINANDGTRRWSYDTTSHDATLRDRNDLNSSPALGRRGIYIGSEDGHLYYVPYDYCLHRPNPRCRTASGQAFPDELTSVFPVTAGGSTESGRLRAPVAPATVVNTRLVVRHEGQTVDAAIDAAPPASALVHVRPAFDFDAALSGDGHFLFVVPGGFLAPDTEYEVGVAGSYTGGPVGTGGVPAAGDFSDTIRFHTTRALGPLPIRTGTARVSAFRLRRLAVPMPAFVPSVDQIGFDSYELLVGTIAKSPPDTRGEGSVLLWVVGARRDRHGRWVADPAGNFAFPLAGRYRADSLLLSAHRLTLTFSFGPVPLERLDLRMQLRPDLHAVPGASLYAVVVCLDVPYYGPLLPLARLCNPDGNLIGSGTFVAQPYRPDGGANARPPGLRVTALALERPTPDQDGAVQAAFALDGRVPYPADQHLVSILLRDADTGEPVILDYRNATVLSADAAGDLAGVRVDLPRGMALPAHLRASVITDVFPLHEEDLR